MYIFKSPKIGGEVGPHQDSTYIISNPLTCKAFWFALEDATTENGCMYGIPGSHKTTPIEYFMHAEKEPIYDGHGHMVGAKSTVKYVPENPPAYKLENYVPLDVKKGSVVLFDGAFVHWSDHNYSAKTRHAFTMHMVEGVKTVWDKKNWLQRTPELPFVKMLQN